MSNIIYNVVIEEILNGDIDFIGNALYVALLADTYVPSITHELFTDINSHEVSGAGYTAGGKELLNKSQVGLNLDADDLTWTAEITTHYAVLYDSTDDKLIALYDFGVNKSSVGGNFAVIWGSSGVLSLVQG